jgi:hypothetical protein
VAGVGLAGVLLTFAVLASLQAFTIPPFHLHDEVSHVGYALAVSRGDLPTIDTPIPGGETPLLQRQLTNRKPANRTIWTANHPPLYYLVAAVPLRLGVDRGRPLGGVRAARLINIGISLAGLALVVLLAQELVPARPELGVAAAGLAALVPGLMRTSAFVYNDALMFTLATAALVLIARVLRWGATPRRVALLAALAAASALTRATGLLVAAVAAVAVLIAVLLRRARRSSSSRWRPPAGSTCATAGCTAAPREPGSCCRSSPAHPGERSRRRSSTQATGTTTSAGCGSSPKDLRPTTSRRGRGA